ncbi:MAG: hypothetical protein VX454_08805 [Pseudomonadota bacterium]|jgi:hypothetical protein|nr:hypothetical protein [Pseudomonadota bacterium]
MPTTSEAAYILELSTELLDDIELDRLPPDKLILKANRLARLAGSEEVRQWLSFEMRGYNGTDPVSMKYMSLTGRWTDYAEKKGYWGPLGQHEATIEAKKIQIEATKLTSVAGDGAFGVTRLTAQNHTNLSQSIQKLSGIRSKVLGLLHTFVAGVFYERQFADVAETTFEGYKKTIDGLIADKAGDLLTKMPSVVARLREGDQEAVSQALTTCRRIIEGFADSIFPPSDAYFELNDNSLKLDASKHLNRINVYVAQRTESSSRRTRIRQNLGNLFDRVSTGVHKDVTVEEAYALFLNVYLFLGEVLNLGDPKASDIIVE